MAKRKAKKEVTPLNTSELVLKRKHTHAGTDYAEGTPLVDLNPSESTVNFLKQNDII